MFSGDVESRFLAKGSVLSIHNINDRDTKKYICIGNYSDGKELLNQSIVLRVEGKPYPSLSYFSSVFS